MSFTVLGFDARYTLKEFKKYSAVNLLNYV